MAPQTFALLLEAAVYSGYNIYKLAACCADALGLPGIVGNICLVKGGCPSCRAPILHSPQSAVHYIKLRWSGESGAHESELEDKGKVRALSYIREVRGVLSDSKTQTYKLTPWLGHSRIDLPAASPMSESK